METTLDPAAFARRTDSTLDTLDTMVRHPRRLDAAVLDDATLPRWLSRMIRLSVVGLAVHGLVVGLVVQAMPPDPALADWFGALPALTLPLTLVAALFLGLAVCLPSFWFYTQLAGLDVSFRFVTAQAVRVQAHTAVLLLGALPVYAAAALAAVLDLGVDATAVALLGLALPFIVGLSGIRSLHASFAAMLPDLPISHARRGRFLLRLVLCWGAVYSVVTPVALWRIGAALAGAVS